jgi:pectate lyase
MTERKTDLMKRLLQASTTRGEQRKHDPDRERQARPFFPIALSMALLAAFLAAPASLTSAGAAPLTSMGVKAFPSAEGYGKNAVGGRGGRVFEVTNLNDSGPGSLRTAVDSAAPRIVVFRTGGTIKLQTPLTISSPFITIAGQTGTGGGISLRNDPSNGRPSIRILTHDVVIRHLRVRPGPSAHTTDVLDAVQIGKNAYNVVIDHCSMSWAVDENVNTWDTTHDITVQWSIISEALNESVHPEGAHSRGFLVGGDGEGSQRISIHHNLFAHNDKRNPQLSNNGYDDVVNNVIYNYGRVAIQSTDVDDQVEFNVVGNYVKPGPDSSPKRYGLDLYPITGLGWQAHVGGGNIGPIRQGSPTWNWGSSNRRTARTQSLPPSQPNPSRPLRPTKPTLPCSTQPALRCRCEMPLMLE